MKIGRALLPLVAIVMCSAALADDPFDGTWALNIEKSHVAAATLSWEDLGSGRLRFTNMNFSYTFRPDGHEFTTPLGLQQTIEKISDGLYRIMTKRNGVLLATETWKLSSDGRTLFMESRGTRPNGQPFDNRQTYIRTSGSTGLAGNWRGDFEVKLPRNALTIRTAGRGAVTLTFAADKSTVHGKWDGRDYPESGPAVRADTTMALSRTGPDAFRLIHKYNSTVVEILRFRLAADGKSMIVDDTNGKGRELLREVWDKRS